MIILDTNVFSELGRDKPDPLVSRWAASLWVSEVFLTSISRAEVLAGLAVMPSGARSRRIARLEHARLEAFNERVLTFDFDAADAYAGIVAARRKKGLAVSIADSQIAAIASVRNAVVATRNLSDFELAGVELVNPWEPAA